MPPRRTSTSGRCSATDGETSAGTEMSQMTVGRGERCSGKMIGVAEFEAVTTISQSESADISSES